MAQKNIGTMRAAYDAFAKGEYTRLPFAPDIEWIEPDVEGLWTRGTHHGVDAVIKDVFESTVERFDDFRVQCDEYLEAGNRVIVMGRFMGRSKETGNRLNAPFVHVWTLRNGKIISFRNYTDTANWLHAMYTVHLEHPVGTHR